MIHIYQKIDASSRAAAALFAGSTTSSASDRLASDAVSGFRHRAIVIRGSCLLASLDLGMGLRPVPATFVAARR